jgi:hypothetical protein
MSDACFNVGACVLRKSFLALPHERGARAYIDHCSLIRGGCTSTSVTSPIRRRRITIVAMRSSATRFIAIRTEALILCGLALGASSAQSQIQNVQNSAATDQVHRLNAKRRAAHSGLSPDDGLSVIAAALDSQVQAARERDCSHLVHAIYLRAGFPYSYASSTDLYEGAEGFLRVTRPQPGDLVVWPGHVGIVVNPAQHLFFSRLRRGPGVEAYDAQYWKERGQAKFYRYITTGPAHVTTTHLATNRQHK